MVIMIFSPISMMTSIAPIHNAWTYIVSMFISTYHTLHIMRYNHIQICYFQILFLVVQRIERICLISIHLVTFQRTAFFKTRPLWGTGSRALWSYAWHPFRRPSRCSVDFLSATKRPLKWAKQNRELELNLWTYFLNQLLPERWCLHLHIFRFGDLDKKTKLHFATTGLLVASLNEVSFVGAEICSTRGSKSMVGSGSLNRW